MVLRRFDKYKSFECTASFAQRGSKEGELNFIRPLLLLRRCAEQCSVSRAPRPVTSKLWLEGVGILPQVSSQGTHPSDTPG